jgi:pimeloyl-ACP methyl ester carboxylesterase
MDTSLNIFGHSFGAYISIAFAAANQSLVEKLVLCDCAGILTTQGLYGAYWGSFFILSPIQNIMRFLGRLGRWVFHQWSTILNFSASSYYWYLVLGDSGGIGDNIVGNCIKMNWITGQSYWHVPLFRKLLSIEIPIAFMYGERDSITPAHQGRLLSQILNPEIPVIELISIGHNIMTSEAKILAHSIDLALSKAAPINESSRKRLRSVSDEDLLKYGSNFSLHDSRLEMDKFYNALRAGSDNMIPINSIKVSQDAIDYSI